MQKYIIALLLLAECVQSNGQSALLNLDDHGVVIAGYDPVDYFTKKMPVQGTSVYHSTFEGATYYFENSANKDLFDHSPEKYAVQFGGFCAYAVSQGHVSPIDPNFCTVQRDDQGVDRLICQHNAKAAGLWNANPDGLLVDAYQYWPAVVRNGGKQIAVKGLEQFFLNLNEDGLANEGYDVVAYHADNRAILGDPRFSEWFHGGRYQFTSREHQEAFRMDPKKYLPQYGGFCAYAMSLGKVRPVDPKIFSIENGRLFLQHTQEAYDLFYQDTEGNILKADREWPNIEQKKAGHKVKYDKQAK